MDNLARRHRFGAAWDSLELQRRDIVARKLKREGRRYALVAYGVILIVALAVIVGRG